MDEVWRDIPGYEGEYQASNLGRVRSRKCVLRPGLASNGYLTVNLKSKSHTVHGIIAATFIGPRPTGHDVCHKDGVRTNNQAFNLGYGTRAENERQKVSRPRGTDYANAKLNDAAVRTIRKLQGQVSQSALAQQFGVSPAAVQAVHDERTWTHVK